MGKKHNPGTGGGENVGSTDVATRLLCIHCKNLGSGGGCLEGILLQNVGDKIVDKMYVIPSTDTEINSGICDKFKRKEG